MKYVIGPNPNASPNPNSNPKSDPTLTVTVTPIPRFPRNLRFREFQQLLRNLLQQLKFLLFLKFIYILYYTVIRKKSDYFAAREENLNLVCFLQGIGRNSQIIAVSATSVNSVTSANYTVSATSTFWTRF